MKVKDKNLFGGENPNSIYTPMTETEREVVERLYESNEFYIVIENWGIVHKFNRVIRGDLRVNFSFDVTFSKPDVAIPVHYFDLKLMTRTTNILLFKQRYSVTVGGEPTWVGAGDTLRFFWDIAIKQMNPEFVKLVKPGARGLTTREGNRSLTTTEAKVLDTIRKGEDKVRKMVKKDLAKAEKNSVIS